MKKRKAQGKVLGVPSNFGSDCEHTARRSSIMNLGVASLQTDKSKGHRVGNIRPRF